jgi:DNA-binding response OmpR family regulator
MSEPPTLLLVEDDSSIRPFVADLLKDDGYRVIEAEDGKAAIRVLREHRPPADGICLVILDMMLPEANGMEVLRILAELGNYTPVVAMSADYQQLRRARDAGADDTLAKPFNLDELIEVVERNCSG